MQEDIVPDAHFKCVSPKQQHNNNKKKTPQIIIFFYPLGSSEVFIGFVGKLSNWEVVPVFMNISWGCDTVASQGSEQGGKKNQSVFLCHSPIIQQQYV